LSTLKVPRCRAEEELVASDPDILAPPQAVAARLAQWEDHVDGVVPVKTDGANLLAATWNLRAFGDLTNAWKTPVGVSPKRNFADIHAIAAVTAASTWSRYRRSAATCAPCATC
jgi:hypothetical protein